MAIGLIQFKIDLISLADVSRSFRHKEGHRNLKAHNRIERYFKKQIQKLGNLARTKKCDELLSITYSPMW